MLWQLPTIAVNCFLFPIGLLGLLLFYVTKDRYPMSENPDEIIFREEIGLMVSRFYIFGNKEEVVDEDKKD